MYQSVDVSWPQGDYHPGGELGVFVAATSGDGGSLFTQSTFVQDVANVRAAGKALGFYHFNGGQDAAASADYFWAAIRPYYQAGDLIGLDIESYNGGATPAQSPAWALTFVTHLAGLMGLTLAALRPGIYGNRSTMGAPGWGALEAAGCWLWLAAPGGYPENTPVGEWSKWTILQYSSAGNIDQDESEFTFNQIAQEGDMPLTPADIGLLLNFPAYDGGPTISSALKQLVGRVSSIGDAVEAPVIRDGVKVPQIQDNADTGTIVRQLAAAVGQLQQPAAASTVDLDALAKKIAPLVPAGPTTINLTGKLS